MVDVRSLSNIGFSSNQSRHLGDTFAVGLSAKANASATGGFQLAHSVVQFTVVTEENNSTLLPYVRTWPQGEVMIRNDGDENLNVYAQKDEYINKDSSGVADVIPPGSSRIYKKISDIAWVS